MGHGHIKIMTGRFDQRLRIELQIGSHRMTQLGAALLGTRCNAVLVSGILGLDALFRTGNWWHIGAYQARFYCEREA